MKLLIMNKYYYKISENITTEIEANDIVEADKKYQELTGLNPQKASVTIDFAGKKWNNGKYEDIN